MLFSLVVEVLQSLINRVFTKMVRKIDSTNLASNFSQFSCTYRSYAADALLG